MGEEGLKFCSLCRNHCLLSNPKCPEVLSDAVIRERLERERSAGEYCNMCKNQCHYTALGCGTGEMVFKMRNRDKNSR